VQAKFLSNTKSATQGFRFLELQERGQSRYCGGQILGRRRPFAF